MASARISVILLLLLLFCADQSHAAFRGLFLLGDINQSISLDYLYSGTDNEPSVGTGRTSSNHRFRETYNGAIKYALLSPRILNGQLKAGIKLDQNQFSASDRSSTSSARAGFIYSVDGIFFDRKPCSLSFFSRSDYTHVSLPFGTAYDIETDSLGLGLTIKNVYVPFWADYSRSVSETDGAPDDRRQTTERITLRASHTSLRSNTEVSVLRSEFTSGPISGSSFPATSYLSFLFNGRNSLSFSDGRIRLTSGVSFIEDKNPERQQRVSLTENFTWNLGRALLFGAEYGGSFSEIDASPSRTANDTKSHFGSVSLTHNLYQSLVSRVSLSGRQISQDSGDENQGSLIVDLTYTKKLTPHDGLRINFSERRSITERNLAEGVLLRESEELAAQIPGAIPGPLPGQEDNLLKQVSIDLSTVEIRDNVNRAILYERGRDYEFTSHGAFTGIDFSLPTSRIVQGQVLFITYSYQVDTSVKYESYARNLSLGLAFNDGMYKFGAAMQQSGQSILSGNTRSVSTYDDLYYSLDASWQSYTSFAGLRYVNNDSVYNPYQSIEATARTGYRLGGGGLTLQVRDRFTMNGVSSFRKESSTDNLFSCSAGYSRTLFGGSLQVTAAYANSASGDESRDDISFESAYRWAVGRLNLDINAQTHFRNTAGSLLRNDQLNLRVVRTF